MEINNVFFEGDEVYFTKNFKIEVKTPYSDGRLYANDTPKQKKRDATMPRTLHCDWTEDTIQTREASVRHNRLHL